MKTLARYSWTAPIVSGTGVLLCLIYCRIWWTPRPMALSDPDESIICWMFCSTMNDVLFYMGIIFALLSMAGGVMVRSDLKKGTIISLISGVLLVPIGIINFIPVYYSGRNIR